MAKLADAADLKSAGAKSPVGVRFPLPAPAIGAFASTILSTPRVDWLRKSAGGRAKGISRAELRTRSRTVGEALKATWSAALGRNPLRIAMRAVGSETHILRLCWL
jgi:hypothetical protein